MVSRRMPALAGMLTLTALAALAIGASSGAAGVQSKAKTCFGKPVTIPGGQFTNDTIVGTPGPDVSNTYDGNDTIDGRGGNDLICSGNGNDVVQGGAGNDKILGLKGDQVLVGDYIDSTGPDGNDLIRGGPGK